MLGLFVHEPAAAAPGPTRLGDAPVLSGPGRVRARRLLHRAGFRRLCVVAALLGLVTVGDGFVYLVLQDRDDLPARAFPLLAVGTSLAFLVLAVPLGRLADRVGRWPVVVAGYGCLLAVYLLLGSGAGPLWLVLALYGAFYAATDGVLSALAVPLLPEELRTTGLALLQTGQALAYVVSSVGFGLLWQHTGVALACLSAAGVAVLAAPLLRRPAAPRAAAVSGLGTRGRLVVAALAAAVLVVVTVAWALSRPEARVEVDPSVTLTTPGVLVRDTVTGRLALVRPDGSRAQTAASCSRVHVAGGRAVCLRPDPLSPSTFVLDVLGPDLAVQQSLPVNGVPTRTRMSADGRVLAWTVFVSGDSYTSSGFSTRSGLLDLATGVLVTSLEDFRLVDDQGRTRRPPVDANFWGVSFADDDNTFYATMATGSHFYLVQGDFAGETLTVLADGVECPSLSPDGTRLVHKRRLPDRTWRLEVHDLASGRRTPLAETGNVDDQAAWLDDATLAYGKVDPATGAVAVWTVPADGGGAPALLAADAESPSGRVPG